MDTNSYLCRFLAAHPGDWEERLKRDYDLRIKRDGEYAVFNYEINADFYDPIVQEARGIILDTEQYEVVCWPFRKFGNHNEGYADPIDWSNARVLEKVDGSIIKLWYDHARGDWQFSTNGTIRAELAGVDVLILPINGAFGNLNATEGARAAGVIGAELTIPCHYWNFAEHGGDPALFAETMKTQYPDLSYLLMRPGESIEL